jgi:hypothetical protein
LKHSIRQIFVQAQSSFSLFFQLDSSWSSCKHSSWAVVLNSFLSCSAHYFWVCCHSNFECVVTRVTDRLDGPFLCKRPSSTSVKTLFNISAQPQLLEVEGPGDVGIVKAEFRYILCSCFIFIFFSHFFDCCILVRIELI